MVSISYRAVAEAMPLRLTRLLAGLLLGGVAYGGPVWVAVHVTGRCNLKCPGCQYHADVFRHSTANVNRRTVDMPISLFEKLCADLREVGTGTLILTGEGEPTLHANLVEFVLMAKKAGFRVLLLTNGLLTDRSLAKALIEARLDFIRTSLWAASPQGYATNYPTVGPEAFGTVLAGLATLEAMKQTRKSALPIVGLHYPICGSNVNELDQLLNLAAKAHADRLSLSPLLTHGLDLPSLVLSPEMERATIEKLQLMRPELERHGIRHNVDEVRLRYRLGDNVWQRVPCYIGWLHACVKPDGNVFACDQCKTPLGNMENASFKQIWNGEAFQSFRRRLMTLEGLAQTHGHESECGFCCHTKHNYRVDRFFRRLRFLGR